MSITEGSTSLRGFSVPVNYHLFFWYPQCFTLDKSRLFFQSVMFGFGPAS